MKIEKRASGSYRVRKMYKGQMYTVTFEHKPTQKEAMLAMAKELERTERALGIPKFSIHKFRHYFASKMSAMNVPEADIMRMGGWETDHIMKSVYRHSMMGKEEQAKRDAAEKLRNALFS